MIYSIARDWGPGASLVRVVTDSPIEDIVATGWLGNQEADIERLNNGPFEYSTTDAMLITIVTPVTLLALYTAVFTIFPDRLSVNPNLSLLPNLQNITAHAGGGQTLATQLNVGIDVVQVVASQNDSVLLPDDVLGQTVIIVNRGANVLAVYPTLGDSIDTLSPNLPVYVFPGETYILYGSSTLNWSSVNLPPVLPNSQGVVATGTTQADAKLLNIGISVITSVAAGSGVILPANTLGQQFVVCNRTGTTVAVYPPVGSNYFGLGTNAALALASDSTNYITGTQPTVLDYF